MCSWVTGDGAIYWYEEDGQGVRLEPDEGWGVRNRDFTTLRCLFRCCQVGGMIKMLIIIFQWEDKK